MPAWVLPASIFVGFALFFAVLFQDRLLPAAHVKIAPVLVTEEAATTKSGHAIAQPAEAVLFQASGWIEPDPYPIKVTVLTDGVIATVEVLEGQDVEKDQLLVSLVDEDARLVLSAAERRHTLLTSAREVHLAAVETMKQKRQVTVQEVAAAQAMAADAEDQLARLDRVVKTSAISQSDYVSGRFRLEREKSLHLAAKAKEAEAAAEVRRMELETQSKNDEIALAAVAVDQAKLALRRTQVRAPVKGRVLRLMAAPGDKKMLGMDHPDSSTVCILYEPEKLQARVDVPLSDAAHLRVGQKARIHTSMLSNVVFEGEVLRINGEADLQRNTLQAKVHIKAPADQLRPEMLCRVEFLIEGKPLSGEATSLQGASSALSLWVPADALHGDQVWVCDPETRKITARTVTRSGQFRDGYQSITEGLLAGEWVVLSRGDWRDGQRVNPQPIKP